MEGALTLIHCRSHLRPEEVRVPEFRLDPQGASIVFISSGKVPDTESRDAPAEVAPRVAGLPRDVRVATRERPFVPLQREISVGTVQVGVREVWFQLDRSVEIGQGDRKSTRLNSSHRTISYAVFC